PPRAARRPRQSRGRHSTPATPPSPSRLTDRAPPAHAPTTRPRPGRAIRFPSSRRFLLRSWGSPRTLPTRADEAGGTAVKFYELRDNLGLRTPIGNVVGY